MCPQGLPYRDDYPCGEIPVGGIAVAEKGAEKEVTLKISVFEETEQWITDVYYIAMGIYCILEHFGIRFKDEGMVVRNVLARKEVLYVEHPAEEEVYKRFDGRLVVLRGPKGDDLSMVALAALTRKILHDHAVVVDAIAARDCLKQLRQGTA